MTDSPLTGLVSIHDVMPETLSLCHGLIASLRTTGVDAITLLIVPGKNWQSRDIDQLRQWQDEGLQLAGHGWTHRAATRSSLYHKLHGLLLSRMAAEHLSLDSDAIHQLIMDCHQWFQHHDLAAPTLYVPPAWALGPLQPQSLQELPFTRIEILGGVLDVRSHSVRRLPLTGYEADTVWRAMTLRCWNRFNEWRARRSGQPLRIGIHPYDGGLFLARQMQAQIRACTRYIDYDAL